ncbi:MAG: efflux RND transporter periplasmic adaptor subunit [Ferruginibacter sp.]
MKKKIISIATALLIVTGIGMVLANNKSKIDKAANPVKEQAVIPVKVHEVDIDSFNTSFSLSAETAPAKEVKIASEVQGKLVGLYIKNGDLVGAGQVIATLDASVLNAQLSSIEASIAKANLDKRRYENLIKLGGATPMQLESVELQYNSLLAEKKSILQQMAHMQIRAPFSGKIENVAVELGSFVSYGTVLSELINNSELKINVFLSEQEAILVKTGQEVNISSVVLAQPKKGEVSMVSDKADASGKFLTEIMVNNSGAEKLKAGMLTDVSFEMKTTKTALAVPAAALISSAKEPKVFVVNENIVEQRIIKTGVTVSNKVEVTEGLLAGDRVVISGQLNLENGTKISIIE